MGYINEQKTKHIEIKGMVETDTAEIKFRLEENIDCLKRVKHFEYLNEKLDG